MREQQFQLRLELQEAPLCRRGILQPPAKVFDLSPQNLAMALLRIDLKLALSEQGAGRARRGFELGDARLEPLHNIVRRGRGRWCLAVPSASRGLDPGTGARPRPATVDLRGDSGGTARRDERPQAAFPRVGRP